MKILHLPINVASQVSVTVRALRAVGMEARGIVRATSVLHDCSGLETLDWSTVPRGLGRLRRSIRWRWRLIRAVLWADVVHWHWGESTWRGYDLRLIRRLGKPALVEFWGDDLRVPEIASRDNPYQANLYREHPEFLHSPNGRHQRLFMGNGFEPILPCPEFVDYLDPTVCSGYYRTRQRLMLEDYAARFPNSGTGRPLLLHAPSSQARKGTETVHRVIQKLSARHELEFRLIEGMTHAAAMEIMSGCDVYLDQFVLGSEGVAVHEAMAFGKPVVCYIKPSIADRYPAEFPVVSADQESLEGVLDGLLRDGGRRHALGKQGRAYVEKYNDARKVASELVEIYEDLLARKSDPSRKRCRHWRTLDGRHQPREHN